MMILLALLLLVSPCFAQNQDLGIRDGDYVDYTQDASCLGAWRYNDDLHDTAIDSSSIGRQGNVSGNGSIVAGQEGNCWDYDGTDDWIDYGLIDTSGLAGMSIVAWVFYDSIGTQEQTVASNYDGVNNASGMLLRLEPSNDTVEAFIVREANTVSGGTFADMIVPANTWTHVASVFNSTDLRVYVNGVVTGSPIAAASAMDNDPSTDPFRVGDSPHTTTDELTGKIDEVAVFSRALSAAEILDIYKNGIK